MSHESTIFLLGILIALTPFLGLPYSWLMVIVPVLSVLTALFAILARARRLADAHVAVRAPAPLNETSSTIG